MKKTILLVAAAILVLVLGSCDNLIVAKPERITFALIVDDLSLDAMTITADVHDHNAEGALLEVVTAKFVVMPNTTGIVWAQMTTLEELPTDHRYHLDFWIDINTDSIENAGDRVGIQTFEVRPNVSFSETKYFASDLLTLP